MKIEFEIGKDNQEVLIKSSNKVIGRIFTPAGSGETTLNAIQVCGFEEAYDLWGCGVYGEKVKYAEPITKEKEKRIRSMINSDAVYMREMRPYYEDILSKGYEEKVRTVMKKDIQLLFKEYDNDRNEYGNTRDCWCCFNDPCTCEIKGSHIDKSPFTVKREHGLKEENKLWYKTEDKEKK